ncbi:MAG: hypothetical protein C5B58_01105 [Acidobacteria bacterium]|nr:MAG: hypothetical protein C5B58_01105 [Acidobacteriota bacterium]
MILKQNAQRNHDKVELFQLLDSKNAHWPDDTWIDDNDHEDGDLFDVGPRQPLEPIVGWPSDAFRALTAAKHVRENVVSALKRCAFVAKSAVVQCRRDWTGRKRAILETRELPNKTAYIRIREPIETTVRKNRLLKAKLVKRITDDK